MPEASPSSRSLTEVPPSRTSVALTVAAVRAPEASMLASVLPEVSCTLNTLVSEPSPVSEMPWSQTLPKASVPGIALTAMSRFPVAGVPL